MNEFLLANGSDVEKKVSMEPFGLNDTAEVMASLAIKKRLKDITKDVTSPKHCDI